MRRTLALAALVAGELFAAPAWAGALDFQLTKLVPPSDITPGGVVISERSNQSFRIFANQLGAAITSMSLEPPGTLGQSGFDVSVGYTVAHVNAGADVWPTNGNAGSTVRMPTLLVRKGLPQSFELGGRFTFLEQSQMRAGTLQLKWSPMEGLDYMPDLSARAHVTRLFGARDFGLVTGGFDLSVGKRFTVLQFLTALPYAGYDLLLVNADSKVIDFYSGVDYATHEADVTKYQKTFDLVWLTQNVSHRFYLGLRLARSIVDVSAELSWVRPIGYRTVFASSLKAGLSY